MKKAPRWGLERVVMPDWLLAIFVKPFVFLAVFVVIYFIKEAIWRVLPDGKIKRVLFSPLPGHRER